MFQRNPAPQIEQQSQSKTFECYKKAAEQGRAVAQYNLAICYVNGIGIEKDEKQAVEWYKKAAAQGYAKAQCNLGVCYEKGTGIEKDEKQAFEWYKKAAVQGHATAQCNLGVCYEKGTGNEKDEKQAYEWYEKAAAQGYAVAQCNLGVCYADGIGIEKDEKQVFEWYKKAAAQGYVKAQCNLAVCYADGIGIEKDEKQAFEWYEKAAAKGYAVAQFYIGNCYGKGKGVVKNQEKAYEFFQKAAAQEHQTAKYLMSKEIGYNADSLLEQIAVSKECYVPCQLPDPIDQEGPYCGVVAFVGVVKYAGCLTKPLYATHYEKQAARGNLDDHRNEDDHGDEILYQMQHFPDEQQRSDGPIYSIHYYQKLAGYLADHQFGNPDGKAVLKENYTEEEYTAALIKAFRENKVLVLPGDEENEMPVKGQGQKTHWVFALGYWRDEKDNYYLLVSHHGYYCKWSIHDLYESNKQLPEENPRKKGGHLKEYRYSFYEVRVKNERKMIDKSEPSKKMCL